MVTQGDGEIVEEVAAVNVLFMEKGIVSGVDENGVAETRGEGTVGVTELVEGGFGVGGGDAASFEFVEGTEKMGDIAVLASAGGC